MFIYVFLHRRTKIRGREMSRLGISYTEVAAAADELIQAGLQPTIERIRDQLGKRGSFSTISKYLKDWREGRPVTKPTIITPPDPVQAAVSTFWEKLHQETQTTIETIKTETSEQLAAANQIIQQTNTTLAALTTEHETLKVDYQKLAVQKELLTLDFQQVEINQQLLRERLTALESHYEEIKLLHAQQLQQLEKKSRTEIENLCAQTAREVMLAQQLADTLKTLNEEARAEHMRQLDELKVENKKYIGIINQLEIENSALKEEIKAKTHTQKQLAIQNMQAEKTIQLQQDLWHTLQDKLFVTEDMMAAFSAIPVQLAEDLQLALTTQIEHVIQYAIKKIAVKKKGVKHAEKAEEHESIA